MKITKSGTSFHEVKRSLSALEFPNRFTEYVQSFGETYYWEKGKFHVITRASHAREILLSEKFSADRGSFFVSRMPNLDLSLIQGFFGVVRKMMVMSDGEDHQRRRKAMAQGFDDVVLERFKGKISATVGQLIFELKGKQEFEFVEAVAKRLPSTVLADLFSVPEKDRERFLHWSNVMTGFFGGASQYRNEDGIEVNEAALSLKSYFEGLLSERRHSPGEDFVSHSLKAQRELGLSDDELVSQLIMMLVAGMATTTDQLCNIVFLLAANPKLQALARENPHKLPRLIEECKRFDPAVTFIFRVAKVATSIGEQEIAPGDVIFISTHAINRDLPPEQRPFELDPDRIAAHFSYGHGPHYCLGAKLGRLEIEALIRELLHGLPTFQLDPARESERDHYSLSFSGFKSLHLKVL